MLILYVISIVCMIINIVFALCALFDQDYKLFKLMLIFSLISYCSFVSLKQNKIESKKRLEPTYKITINENNVADTTFIYKELWK